MPYLSRAADRPVMTSGVQSGDIGADGGIVWARADRPSQVLVEVATSESFANVRALPPIAALPKATSGEIAAAGLARGAGGLLPRPVSRSRYHVESSRLGRFRTAPADRRDVSFVWARRRRQNTGHQPG